MNIYAVVIAAALLLDYALSVTSSVLTVRSLNPALPREFEEVFDADKYARSQQYTRTRVQFGLVRATFGLAVVLLWWQGGGFNWLDQTIRSLGHGPVVNGVLYMGVLTFGSGAIGLPFRLYSTFVIEERYGFNRTTIATFVADMMKGVALTALLGGTLLTVVLLFFEWAGPRAWLWCWGATALFTLAIQFVAPTWIMPLFNTFTPLQSGELRDAILECANSAHFPLKGIFVVDGSRRSSKANAFFTGFGRNRRIGLFDTLVDRHSVAELVAVVAHEIGHYKLRHIGTRMVLGLLHLGAVFFVLSLFLTQAGLFDAFYMDERSVYAGLVFFGLLFTPVDLVLSVFLNMTSRRHEFQADAFAAKTTGDSGAMISALKTLARDTLTNLTPHPLDVFLHHSHPPVSQRIARLRELGSESTGG